VPFIKKKLGVNVLEAAKSRISEVFDNFEHIYVSFSGGKDSSVMLHLVMAEAKKRNRKIGVLFVDLEAQYALTIEHIRECYDEYAANIDPYWVALPIALRNAVSNYQPQWLCWDPDAKDMWVRERDPMSIADESFFPFFERGMEFEDFIEVFGEWYGKGEPTACFVGIRCDESLNRWRTLTGDKAMWGGRKWSTQVTENVTNIYPIYDWKTADLWVFSSKTGLKYNKLYDRMHQAGLTIHAMRICQPYGDDQRKGLWLYQVIEPQTWGKVVARVNGANFGSLYAQESGNVLGRLKIAKPNGHTWKSFAKLLLDTLPPAAREHYTNKIIVFLKWYSERGYPDDIPDDGPVNTRDTPSWARVCKMLLKNDYWGKTLGFSQHKTGAYQKYLELMRRRKEAWGIKV
jgi:predicted phosphoadenosine phosphosulfate sulfurtransferase